ncbi:MAG: PDZ domain-containing protein [Clostridia bacterium]|nr:PDZ domain-containing protein [Clostridia bacterium]
MKNKRFSFSTLITLVILAVALAISVTMMIAMRHFNSQVNAVTQRQALYNHINDIDTKVRQQYPSIDEEALRSALAAGYVNALSDPYAQYLDSTAYKRAISVRQGQVTDLGITLKAETSGLVVSKVASGSAAQQAGVLVGDLLVSVDGVPVFAPDRATLQRKLDTTEERVLLSVKRGDKTMAFDLTAYSYQIQTVTERMLSDSVGYIRISTFLDNTVSQFRAAFSSLENQGAVNFVFDLRGCTSGGSRESLEGVLSYLMPHGAYAIWSGNTGESYNLVADTPHTLSGSSVTLVNKDTRGEAELFAGILQEFSMTTVIGEKTAGKGKFQDFVTLQADNSALSLTVGEITLMRGGSIEGVGITPNKEVLMLAEKTAMIGSMADADDDQLQAALSVFSANLPVGNAATTAPTVSATPSTGTTETTAAQ